MARQMSSLQTLHVLLVGTCIISLLLAATSVESRLVRPPPAVHNSKNQEAHVASKVSTETLTLTRKEQDGIKHIDLYLEKLFRNINRSNRPRYGRSVPIYSHL